MKQKEKKRIVFIEGIKHRITSKRIKFKNIDLSDREICHCKISDVHYIFDGSTGNVITQGLSYTQARNNFIYEYEKNKQSVPF